MGATRVYHLRGLEFAGRGHTAEPRTLGVLRWQESSGRFEYVAADWLRTFTRENWETR
jgi:hypothetical protein